jgi:hypothetical protein
MRPNRISDVSRRPLWIAAGLLVPWLAWSQSATSVWVIDVAAPSSFVLSGRTLQLKARARNAFGATLRGFTPEWRSSDAAVASVDAAGLVRGSLPGLCDIEAFDPGTGIVGRQTIRVYPSRVEIQPSTLEIRVGEQARLNARAIDADGNPIPGLGFLWTSGVPGVASVNLEGTVTGAGEGAITVSAMLDLRAPGFHFGAEIPVRVRPRPAFKLTRLVSTGSDAGPTTMKAVGATAFADNDQIAFIAPLSNGGQALMHYDRGRIRTLAFAGQYIASAGRTIGQINQVVVSSAGEVAAGVTFPTEWCNDGVLLFRRDRPPALLEANCGIGLGRGMGSAGELAYTLWDFRQNLYLRRADGARVRIISNGDSIPEIGTVQGITQPAISPRGTVIFEANGSRGRGLFSWDGRTIRKLLLIGESVDGEVVQNFDLAFEGAPGVFYTQVWGPNYTAIRRLAAGGGTLVAHSNGSIGNVRVGWIFRLLAVRDDTIAFFADATGGRAVFKVSQGTATTMGSFKSWSDVGLGFLLPTGDVLVQGPGGSTRARLMRVNGSGDPTVLVDAGFRVEPSVASLDWRNVLKNNSSGDPVFRASGEALVSVRGDGFQAVTGVGDGLPGGSSITSLGTVASSTSGELAFTANRVDSSAVYLWRNGGLALVAESNGRVKASGGRDISWFPSWNGSYIAVNDRRQVAVLLSVGSQQELTLFDENATAGQRIVTLQEPAPGGGQFTNVNRVALDNSGRVAFEAHLSNGNTGLFLWESSRLRRIFQTGDSGPRDLKASGFQNLLASSDRFYAKVQFGNITAILELDGSQVRSIVTSQSAAALGGTFDSFYGPDFAVSGRGEVAYPGYFRELQALVVRKPDGKDLVVASTGERGPQGESFLGFFASGFNAQGDLFFSTLTWNSGTYALALYRASPQ